MQCSTPVSYTHLDVYKRQAQPKADYFDTFVNSEDCTCIRNFCKEIGDVYKRQVQVHPHIVQILHIDQHAALALAQIHQTAHIVVGSVQTVSYTHLDVYKRQSWGRPSAASCTASCSMIQ